jgi:uncharacterized protein (DUF1697 family)
VSSFAVFLRGVNVGGNKKFSPAALAKELAAVGGLDVANVGAAGTFVVRKGKKTATASALRRFFAAKLPFEAGIAIVPGPDLVELVDSSPFPKARGGDGDDVRRMLAVLTAAATKKPKLPLRRPDGPDWQMHLVRSSGAFVPYLWRPIPGKMLYTDVVDREFGVPATSRSWNTIEKIRGILGS